MNKVVEITNPDGVVIDITFGTKTTPPVVIPVSDRAIKKLSLPEDCDCAIFLEDSPEDVLELFKPDYIFLVDRVYSPKKILAMTINMLH